MQNFPTERLKEWFVANRRPLPWRDKPTPYRVWISEVMLQQTQVAVVIPYFERWMEAFPTIEALAEAPLERVLKCWEGLGYYSRARNMHQAAGYLVEHWKGELPTEKETLSQIKGIGDYTQGAIRSFAFHQKAAAVDGNVLRVLSRFLAFEEEIDTPKAKAKIQEFAERILPESEPWVIAEGLIELGATVCVKRPKCEECPLKSACLAFRHQMQHALPRKRARPKTLHLNRQVGVVLCKGNYLLRKGNEGLVMADLYEFPYLEKEDQASIVEQFSDSLGIPLNYVKPLPIQKHSFTRYRVTLFPHLLESEQLVEGHLWKGREEIEGLPFSSGHKRILAHLDN